MLPLLISTKALSLTIIPALSDTPAVLVPLKSQPMISAVVPAPLICISISEGPFVRAKEQPASVIVDAPDCRISNVFRLKLTAFMVLRALLFTVIPVPQRVQVPPLMTNEVFDPVTLIPVFAAIPVVIGAPVIVQLLHCSVVLLMVRPVPLNEKRQVSNKYVLALPAHIRPVWKFTMPTLMRSERFPADREIPVANGADDWKVILAICIALFDISRLLAGVLGIINVEDPELPTIEILLAVMVRGPALLFSTYIPGSIRIAIGLTLDAIPFAMEIA
jgi:hypothetical protein